MTVGAVLPLLPLLIWDSRQHWANIRNILDYFLIAQYRIYVPNSWHLFLFQQLPDYWGFVVGRWLPGLVLMILFGLLFFFLLLKRKISPEFLALGLIFLIMLVANRYYHGERSEGYLLYLAPFIIIFTAWLIKILWDYCQSEIGLLNQPLLIGVIGFIIFSNLLSCEGFLSYDSGVKKKQALIEQLISAYPEEKLSLYDFQGENLSTSFALSLLLTARGKSNSAGHPLGFIAANENELKLPEVARLEGSAITMVDLDQVDDLTSWAIVNQASIYNSHIGWIQKNELRSPFSLRKYLEEKWSNLLNK